MATPEPSPQPQVLVVYGTPPTFTRPDPLKRKLPRPFLIGPANRASYENALRAALGSFTNLDTPTGSAKLAPIATLQDLRSHLSLGRYTHVVYHGHGTEDLGSLKLKPSKKAVIGAKDLVSTLKEFGVKHIDMLGCRSSPLAAEIASMDPSIRAGGLLFNRTDDLEVVGLNQAVVKLDIVPQAMLHFGGKEK